MVISLLFFPIYLFVLSNHKQNHKFPPPFGWGAWFPFDKGQFNIYLCGRVEFFFIHIFNLEPRAAEQIRAWGSIFILVVIYRNCWTELKSSHSKLVATCWFHWSRSDCILSFFFSLTHIPFEVIGEYFPFISDFHMQLFDNFSKSKKWCTEPPVWPNFISIFSTEPRFGRICAECLPNLLISHF